MKLGGALAAATTITTNATNTLAVSGLQTGATTDEMMVVDASGVLKKVAASTSASIRTETASYSAVIADETILADASSGNLTVTLPANPTVGKRFSIKKVDTSNNDVIINGNGKNIDGTTTVSGSLPYQGWVLQYNGTAWFIISRI